MSERPILFSAPMVRALLDGSKTQTRRVAKLTDAAHVKEPRGQRRWHPGDPAASIASPYGQPGDRLWVRETWRSNTDGGFEYKADGGPMQSAFTQIFDDILKRKWKPSIHMPRVASRITLVVTRVRVERLHAINEVDSIAEGVEKAYIDAANRQRWVMYKHDDGTPGEEIVRYVGPSHTLHPINSYKSLWLNINGPGSWDANPLVWVIEFKRVTP